MQKYLPIFVFALRHAPHSAAASIASIRSGDQAAQGGGGGELRGGKGRGRSVEQTDSCGRRAENKTLTLTLKMPRDDATHNWQLAEVLL